MMVKLTDTEYTREKNVVGMIGEIMYIGKVKGTFVFVEECKKCLYFLKDEDGFTEIRE